MEGSILRELGVSDKYFYYTAAGKGSTMDIRLPITFKAPVNHEALILATSEALRLYPEFSARPVLHEGRLFYEDNHEDVALLPLSSRYDFGSDDMNGYLFCFQYDALKEREVVFSVYHALSDWNGLSRFLKAIICRYAVHVKGLRDDYFGDVIRSHEPSRDEWETQSNLNPYEVYGDERAIPSYKPEITGEIFTVSEEYYGVNFPASRHIRITLSTSEFIKAAKSNNTSFVPLMLYVSSSSMRDAYNTDKTILSMFPVDLRKVFNNDCIVNFSDATFLPSTIEQHNMPIEEQCKRFREMLTLSRKPENYAKFLYDKVETVKGFEAFPGGIIAKSRENSLRTGGRLTRVTQGVTYPGIMDMPEGADDLIEDIVMESPFGVPLMLVTTYHDTMSITSIQRYEGNCLEKAICRKLSSLGLETEIAYNGLVEQNVMNLERLRSV
ncbi:MAG: hypothetical protein IJP89_01115 [Synergistaceae bacterium]|nr:hypothetical protein [Synergistaceae bacterium]